MEEENRIKSFLHPSTLPSILQILDDVLIRDQLDRILDGVEFLLIGSSHRGKQKNFYDRFIEF
jgi:hypothetical protein